MREPIGVTDVPDTRAEIDLTPMLDVVFIMLIFFLVVASFTKEHGLDLDESESTQTDTSDAENIEVSIEPDNQIWIDRRQIDPNAIRANLARLIVERPKAIVIIRADKRSANKALVQVMDASRQAGIYDMSLSSDTPGNGPEPIQY